VKLSTVMSTDLLVPGSCARHTDLPPGRHVIEPSLNKSNRESLTPLWFRYRSPPALQPLRRWQFCASTYAPAFQQLVHGPQTMYGIARPARMHRRSCIFSPLAMVSPGWLGMQVTKTAPSSEHESNLAAMAGSRLRSSTERFL
jgi:hypothetical protein